jgi:hypothetical protein
MMMMVVMAPPRAILGIAAVGIAIVHGPRRPHIAEPLHAASHDFFVVASGDTPAF